MSPRKRRPARPALRQPARQDPAAMYLQTDRCRLGHAGLPVAALSHLRHSPANSPAPRRARATWAQPRRLAFARSGSRRAAAHSGSSVL